MAIIAERLRCATTRTASGTLPITLRRPRTPDGSAVLHRRRERSITAAYDLEGLGSVDGIRRVLDIVVADSLALENSVGRSRVLIAAAMAATRILEVEELEGGRALLATEVAPCSGEDDETCPG